MQYKCILSALIFAVAAVPAYAQQTATAKHTAVKVDTVKKAAAQPELLASNLVAPAGGVKYAHVPLAGEKAYFGEKTDYVNDFVRKYLETHYNTLGSVQNKSEQPFSVIDNELERKKMPKELKYLAVIESALNHNAVSSAGAVGPWQLMETTAKMMGLSVTRKHDDRTDLAKSTTAATKYLQLLYSQLDDWLLVIAAYNSGPVPVQKAIERTGSHNFWDIKQYLPKETQGHVLAFIATASIFENLSKFINLGSIPMDFKFSKEDDAAAVPNAVAAKPGPLALMGATVAPAATATVKKPSYTDDEVKNMSMVRVNEPLNLEIIAQETGCDKNLLKRWNADYEAFTYGNYPTTFYNLRMPKDKLDAYLSKKEIITKKSRVFYEQNK